MEEKQKRKAQKKAIRRLVWNYYIGAQRGEGLCWCCMVTPINAFEFECGHVVSRAKGGMDTVENLRPICGLCNRSMGTMNMMEFKKLHGLKNESSFFGWLWRLFKRKNDI